jgi:hypothetical protein
MMTERETLHAKLQVLLCGYDLTSILTAIVEETGLELLDVLPAICEDIAHTFTITGCGGTTYDSQQQPPLFLCPRTAAVVGYLAPGC